MKLGAFGLLLTAVVAAILWAVWGRATALAGSAFGILATVIHVVAFLTMRRAWDAPFKKLAMAWAIGMGLRLGGAVVWIVAVLLAEDLFPPVPTAIGFLGVLVPLLFAEMRFLR